MTMTRNHRQRVHNKMLFFRRRQFKYLNRFELFKIIDEWIWRCSWSWEIKDYPQACGFNFESKIFTFRYILLQRFSLFSLPYFKALTNAIDWSSHKCRCTKLNNAEFVIDEIYDFTFVAVIRSFLYFFYFLEFCTFSVISFVLFAPNSRACRNCFTCSSKIWDLSSIRSQSSFAGFKSNYHAQAEYNFDCFLNKYICKSDKNVPISFVDFFSLEMFYGKRGSNFRVMACGVLKLYCFSPAWTGYFSLRPRFQEHNLLVALLSHFHKLVYNQVKHIK